MKNVHLFQNDLTRKENLNEIEEINPGFIIHCAALTNVDYCEEHANEAYNRNILSSIHIAKIAKKIGAHLIYISTDSVFDGEKGGYKEEDMPNPVNIYGRTKLEAERKVLSICPRSCVVRTSIYGWNKTAKFSLAEWMLDKLTKNEGLLALKDIFFSPILVNDLAEILFKLQKEEFRGVIHIAGKELCSKLDFAYNISYVKSY